MDGLWVAEGTWTEVSEKRFFSSGGVSIADRRSSSLVATAEDYA